MSIYSTLFLLLQLEMSLGLKTSSNAKDKTLNKIIDSQETLLIMVNWLSRRWRIRAEREERNRIGTDIGLYHACKYSNYTRDSEKDM